MNAFDYYRPEDEAYIIDIRRELHMYPETRFDLPRTVSLVRRELDLMKIPFTERYGTSSVVATINEKASGFTIGIRADMDALPIQEINDIPYKSRIDGKMHACGHDAHTAMLLGTARALKRAEKDLKCRVKLLFQPAEESGVGGSGAKRMVADGVMDDIDIIIGLHVENWLPSGKIGVCPGVSMAASNPIDVDFYGASAHATLPHTGHDALAMAVSAYNGIQLMLAREMDPFAKWVCSIGALNAGKTYNVVPDHASMKISLRTYDMKLNDFIVDRIRTISENAAFNLGGTAKITVPELHAFPIVNDPALSQLVLDAAKKIVGEEGIAIMPQKLGSEDFSHYLTKKPGVFFRLGTCNPAIGCDTSGHNNNFMIDEAAFIKGSMTCTQFVLDNMNGIS